MTSARAIFMVLILLGCAPTDAEHPSVVRSALIYGDDGRKEVESAAPFAQQIADAVVAIVPEEHLSMRADGRFEPVAPTAAEKYELCEGERFGAQLSLADCAGVHISPTWIVTAGHCVPDGVCGTDLYVRGWRTAAGAAPASFAPDEVCTCRSVLAHRFDDPQQPPAHDYAIVQLDCGVQPDATVGVRQTPVAAQESLLAVSHLWGTPAKVSNGGAVLDARADEADYFEASIDVQRSSSGGPVVDAAGELVGVIAAGPGDLTWRLSDECNRVRQVSDPDRLLLQLRVSKIATALDEACRAAPSAAPCVDAPPQLPECSGECPPASPSDGDMMEAGDSSTAGGEQAEGMGSAMGNMMEAGDSSTAGGEQAEGMDSAMGGMMDAGDSSTGGGEQTAGMDSAMGGMMDAGDSSTAGGEQAEGMGSAMSGGAEGASDSTGDSVAGSGSCAVRGSGSGPLSWLWFVLGLCAVRLVGVGRRGHPSNGASRSV